jgi:hypothetical protein
MIRLMWAIVARGFAWWEKRIAYRMLGELLSDPRCAATASRIVREVVRPPISEATADRIYIPAALAAARADAVMEFAEMLLNEGITLDYGSNVGRESPTDAVARYLARKEPTDG